MKSNLNELNFVSRFLDMIRRGVVDSQMKKLIKKDPELAKKTKEYNKVNKNYNNKNRDNLEVRTRICFLTQIFFQPAKCFYCNFRFFMKSCNFNTIFR